MTAFTKIACALLLSSALAAPAWAADTGSGQTSGSTTTNDTGSAGKTATGQSSMNSQNETKGGQTAMNASQGGMQIRTTLKNDLSKAGFKDIQIMPSSFLVRATDTEGNPVIMMINSNSVTAITEESQASNSANSGKAANDTGSASQTTNGQSASNSQNEANGNKTNGGQSAMNNGAGGAQIRTTLKNDLSKAGFKNVQIMPSSFLVRAKDSKGNPVVMVINPDSVTAVTEEGQAAGSASNANHGATDNNAANNATTGGTTAPDSNSAATGGAAAPNSTSKP